jgi:inner membrane protein involved in colicin E2 resistance
MYFAYSNPMTKRIAAIALIYIFTAIAWMILAGTISEHTKGAETALGERVTASWGAAQEQSPPKASYDRVERHTQTVVSNGRNVETTNEQTVTVGLPLEGSKIDTALDLEHRQKGLLWYSTYKVAFAAAYVYRNTSEQAEDVRFVLNFPAAQAIYDDLQFTLDGKPLPTYSQKGGIFASASVAAGAAATLHVAYLSQGLGTWRYHFGDDVSQVRNFTLNLRTNFRDIDFPDNSLSPTQKQQTADGWLLTWSYKNLVSGYQIAMAMPEKLQPGPLAGEISEFAPVSLLFFFFVMIMITSVRRIDLHPMNYFFLATAFFAFHLLLAYLVDHIPIYTAFAICSIVSVALVVSYLRLVVGIRFAALEAGGAQMVYLVLFSFAFFFKGFTGLAITIGAIISLFVAMQLTGRIKWGEV